MASAPTANQLPVLYKDLVPLNTKEHANWKTRMLDDGSFLKTTHAVPLTAEEFPVAQRYYPIVFSASENPVPLVLMGLNEGINIYMGDDGKMKNPAYIPAYVRRYPFMLVRLRPDSQELSLCFDPTSDAVGEFAEGDALFENGEQSETLKNIMNFCEQFERSVQNTSLFMKELQDLDLLMDGELKIENPEFPQPFVYRGFKMVNEERLRNLRGDELRKINQNGVLPLVYSHLMSLQLMRELFTAQATEGKLPELQQAPNIPPVMGGADTPIN